MRWKRIFSLALSVMMGLTLAGGPAAALSFDDDPEPESLPAFAAPNWKKTPQSGESAGELPPGTREIAKAVYVKDLPAGPQEEDYVDREAYTQARREFYASLLLTADDVSSLSTFFRTGTRQFLTGTNNRVCSPLNIYMALAMLTDLTAGNTQKQILDVLGASSADAVRAQAKKIWNALYTDNDETSRILGASLWLNEQIRFNAETLQKLSQSFYASSYAGQPGSPEFDDALQGWLNEQTRGLVSKQAKGVKMSPNTLLALATTIYFKERWANKFAASLTSSDVFHAEDGDRKASFMRGDYFGCYYRGDGFGAVYKPLHNSGMWLILPDKGVSPAKLLDSGAAMEFVTAAERPEGTWGEISLSLPKFDVSSDLSLIAGLKALGITDAFNYAVADFTPMTTDVEQIELSQVKHAARVQIDEYGCEAAAFTVMNMNGMASQFPPPKIEFTLNRPFLFAVTGEADLPLFVGVVQTPA